MPRLGVSTSTLEWVGRGEERVPVVTEVGFVPGDVAEFASPSRPGVPVESVVVRGVGMEAGGVPVLYVDRWSPEPLRRPWGAGSVVRVVARLGGEL